MVSWQGRTGQVKDNVSALSGSAGYFAAAADFREALTHVVHAVADAHDRRSGGRFRNKPAPVIT
jgi:hypothetical protein